MRKLWIGVVVAGVAGVLGCGEDGHQATPYATYQACFDVHAEDEMLPVLEAIAACCVDHPIADQRPACGADAPACINYLTANLSQFDASYVQVQDACAAYVEAQAATE